MSKEKRLRKLIQKPLRFHHQDIHEEIEVLKAMLAQILVRMDKLDQTLNASPNDSPPV